MKGIDDGEKIKIHLPELGGWKICKDLGNLLVAARMFSPEEPEGLDCLMYLHKRRSML